MISISKLREAIEHLEAAEVLMLDARRAFKVNSLEYDKLTYQADRASTAAEVTKTVLAHVEAGIYQAAQQSVKPTPPNVEPLRMFCGHDTDKIVP